jgi:hypothetical protein
MKARQNQKEDNYILPTWVCGLPGKIKQLTKRANEISDS